MGEVKKVHVVREDADSLAVQRGKTDDPESMIQSARALRVQGSDVTIKQVDISDGSKATKITIKGPKGQSEILIEDHELSDEN